MKALVTGGCGFIGGHLTRRLVAAGHRVTALDDLSSGDRARLAPGAALFRGDVASPADCLAAMEGMDLCIHLAAIASVPKCLTNWADASRTNLLGTVNVLEASQAFGGMPVVLASSAAVYGAAAPPLTEDGPTSPLTNYGIDKLAGEWHARFAGAQGGVPTAILRFFNVYGPGQNPSSSYAGVISRFVAAATAGDAPVVYGDGEQTRDFVYVGDVVEAIMAAAPRAGLHAPVFNVCSGRPVSINALAAMIASRRPIAKRPTQGPPRAGDIRHSFGDPGLARRTLGFIAATPLEEGMRRLVAVKAVSRQE